MRLLLLSSGLGFPLFFFFDRLQAGSIGTAAVAATHMETLPGEIISHVLWAVVDDRDFVACLCAARLFSVCSRADVLERQCRRCRSAAVAARRLSPDGLDHFRRTRRVVFDSAAIHAAASAGRVGNVRWLHEHADVTHRPAIAHGAVACGPRILAAAVKSGSTATVKFLLDKGYRVSRRAFIEAARLGRVDLLRLLDAASPHGDMMCVASAAISENRTDAFVFAMERLGAMTWGRMRDLSLHAADDPMHRSRNAHFALLAVGHGTLDSGAMLVALQVAQRAADIPDVRARLEGAIAAVCADRTCNRHVALGCLPLAVAARVDDPALLQRAPLRIGAEALMKRRPEYVVPPGRAINMARAMWDNVATPGQLVAAVAQWFTEGGDLAGAAAIAWIFATLDLPHPQCLDGASIADVFAFALAHCKGHIDRRRCVSRIMESDDVDLLRVFLDSDDGTDRGPISVVQWDHVRDAARRGNMGVLGLLAQRGYGPWPGDLVASAAQSRRLDVVQFVCNGLGIKVDPLAIVRAVQLDCDDIVAFLCDHCAGACPRMAMRTAVVDNRPDIVRLLRDRKDIGVCRGGTWCCEADTSCIDISCEPMDMDALFAHCPDVCTHWTTLRDAAGLTNDDLFRRIVAEHRHDDIDVRYALAVSLDAGDRRAIRRIVVHFGDRLMAMSWPTRLVVLCQNGHIPLAALETLAQCAPYLCTADDIVRRVSPSPECGVDGECAAEDQFRRMLCERLARSPDAMDTA
ncbi:hypothetical protein psal_cds_908 [Pandoravirus salinus]|uniref:Ankyrin repeat domain containing protein n=1 Tax=Pandoravirus salinus TaxID=1349410 RepID=S4W367_9VIRU|nr:hypothetical protein psal_cds_908 [Pandoravirus salinus]AGO85017.2 hypothetical protein psal_cds_908 [Pandoravirus salinus]